MIGRNVNVRRDGRPAAPRTHVHDAVLAVAADKADQLRINAGTWRGELGLHIGEWAGLLRELQAWRSGYRNWLVVLTVVAYAIGVVVGALVGR